MTEFTQAMSHFNWQCGMENHLYSLCKQFFKAVHNQNRDGQQVLNI